MADDGPRLGVPAPYILGLVLIGSLALLFVLTYAGIIPVDSVYFFFFSNSAIAVLVMALSALGGAFVGMLVSHRILSGREFTPLDRRMMEAITDLQQTVEDLQATETKLLERLGDPADDEE